MADVQPAEPASTACTIASHFPALPPSPTPISTSTPSSIPPTPPSPSSDPFLPPFSSALYDVLSPALTSCDSALTSVFQSQHALASQIDALASVLSSFHSLHHSPLFQPYTLKLQSAKRRIKRLHGQVDKINERMEEMRDMVRRKEGIDQYATNGVVDTGLTSGLSRLTEKVATSLAGLQRGGQKEREREGVGLVMGKGKVEEEEAEKKQKEEKGENEVADGAQGVVAAAASPTPATTSAAIARNNALLHDLLAWDE